MKWTKSVELIYSDEESVKRHRVTNKKSNAPKFGAINQADELFREEESNKVVKERVNLLEEDEDTIRMRQEALEVSDDSSS